MKQLLPSIATAPLLTSVLPCLCGEKKVHTITFAFDQGGGFTTETRKHGASQRVANST